MPETTTLSFVERFGKALHDNLVKESQTTQRTHVLGILDRAVNAVTRVYTAEENKETKQELAAEYLEQLAAGIRSGKVNFKWHEKDLQACNPEILLDDMTGFIPARIAEKSLNNRMVAAAKK